MILICLSVNDIHVYHPSMYCECIQQVIIKYVMYTLSSPFVTLKAYYLLVHSYSYFSCHYNFKDKYILSFVLIVLFCSRGVSRIFERGGSNISWFPKKRSSDFKRGVQWSDRGGGVQYISLPRTTNLAYLDAKE